MEPITLAAVALTVVATKATEKVGEELGEGVIAACRKVFDLLKQKRPSAAKQIAAAAESDYSDVIEAEIVEEVRLAAEADAEVSAAVQQAATALQKEQISLEDIKELIEQRPNKVADKAGVVNMATVETQNITNNF